ncbi:Membrane protein involved in colicin uptake [Labilithrix luteola]|uniref:Membrane protein involved in colicin uptake n=1 Tax=Labilithrix luteola TaxID=1391654 RepID=A0A0K1PLL4_9BACT|nr:DUF2325 domain-containing protein [Labilithrix luteola]AKU94415.1 Membrane protein involved in colicin uptake [Labilithrix luteola]
MSCEMGGPSIVERRRIWQVDPRMHCAVVGTCLALTDLHALARRARWRLDTSVSAYDVHSWFVDYMAFPNELSKLADKELEKRHRVTAKPFRRARTEAELEAVWKEVCAKGQIAGAFWGAMSHPRCSEALQWRLFGEVHMLSHLVGSSRRGDACRIHELEIANAALDERLVQSKQDHRAVVKERKKLEEDLALRTRDLERAEWRSRKALEKIAALEEVSTSGQLQARVDDLALRLTEAHSRAVAVEALLAETRVLLEEARREGAAASEQVRELTAENQALEIELATSVTCPLQQMSEDDEDQVGPALHGKRILCVGGRSNLVQYYRALVERRGGEFLHHDGGLEESLDAVTRALTTVDAVVCPIDCVSHAACLKVKRACKHLAKQFIPLRSSGLSSFARCLRVLAV